MTAQSPSIEHHPDIAALRMRYERAAETPTVQVVDGLTFLAGLFLAMSPWVVGFSSHSSLTATNLMSGIAIAALALGFASAYGRTHGIVWVAPLLGVWTIVAPWLVSGATPSTSAITTNVVVGAVCVLCTLAVMSASMRRPGG
jgi:fatty acid desaturase